MQKAIISARSGRRSGGCNERGKRAKPDAKSDHFGAVWTLSDPVVRYGAEAEKEEAEENYGGLVVALWDFPRTLFLAP